MNRLDFTGRKAAITPVFVIAYGADARPAALLCLGLQKRGPVKLATFLGGKDSNFNIGLIRAGQSWTTSDLRRLLVRATGELGRTAPDAFLFVNQPYTWGGADNPLAALPHQPSPSAAFGAICGRSIRSRKYFRVRFRFSTSVIGTRSGSP